MTIELPISDTAEAPLGLWLSSPEHLETVIAEFPKAQQNWIRASKFSGAAGQVVTVPDDAGNLVGAIGGLGSQSSAKRRRFVMAAIANALPEGNWQFRSAMAPDFADESVLAWLLSAYAFDRYAGKSQRKARIIPPEGVDIARLRAIAEGEFLTRDLINTPANDMGPDELEQACNALADQFGASIQVTKGDDLLDANLPLIHTVGRASDRAPRLIDMSWGTSGPSITLVGKGVCFDTGGVLPKEMNFIISLHFVPYRIQTSNSRNCGLYCLYLVNQTHKDRKYIDILLDFDKHDYNQNERRIYFHFSKALVK